MYPVYLITCQHPSYVNSVMPYVGCCPSGQSVERRFAQHCKSPTASYLHKAIRKYGKEHFRIEQIDAGNTPEQCLELEKWWIATLKTKAPHGGYNLTDGGVGVVGHKDTPEQRARKSEASRRMWSSPAYAEAAHEELKSRWTRGTYSTPEVRQKFSDAQKGNKKGANVRHSDEFKNAVRMRSLGVVPSDETRAKMSAAAKARCTPTWRSKMAEKAKNRMASRERDELGRITRKTSNE